MAARVGEKGGWRRDGQLGFYLRENKLERESKHIVRSFISLMPHFIFV